MIERRIIMIQGTVQGVGFRPYVYGLACKLGLGGFVRNQTGGVWIEVEGDAATLEQFLSNLTDGPPPLARIDELTWRQSPPHGDLEFRIEHSQGGTSGPIIITPDVATCDECLAEMLNSTDRRYRYPFLNCTNCGPRLTIVTGSPYDRAQTTMAGFPMCAACRAEYENPADRRFHAQPTACANCGPRLQLLDAAGKSIETSDPLAVFAAAIRGGKIGAMKGLGGYHLVCDATSESAVAILRQRKTREEKPFAIMVRDIASAETLCEICDAERQLLGSFRRPIVLLRKRAANQLAEAIANRNPFLGIMLPYTPLHHLLLRQVQGLPLVMTSGNRSDEPIAIDEMDAIHRLHDIADIFLAHNRPIHVRCDDSVTRIIGEKESPIRRSRGYAPEPIAVPFACESPILAVGGQMKGTFALGQDHRAIVSHHLGDLDHLEAFRAFERDIALYEKLFSLQPACIAHDLHPDYASTRYAIERAAREKIPVVAVQHHHAHLASCMAEHGLTDPVIGVTFDGTGYGTDGTIWGGEFLAGDYRSFRRAAHLRYVGLPGGEQAVREPWRVTASHLMDAGATCKIWEARQSASALQVVRAMVARKFNAPLTSSAGRLFDAVASIIGLRDRVSYEGQAAIELEALATDVEVTDAYPFAIDENGIIDTRPIIAAIAADTDAKAPGCIIASRFHATLTKIISDVCLKLRAQTGMNSVVLSGGVWMNAMLTLQVEKKLSRDKFAVFRHHRIPANDGGLSFGQIAVAAGQQKPQ